MGRRVVWMVAAVVMTASLASAQERGTTLGGVPFGTHPADVAAAMSRLGLSAAELPDARTAFPLDQTFAGRIDGRHVLVVAMYDSSEALEKLLVSFITTDTECLRFYRDFKLALTEEFGDTHADVEDWKPPYDGGRHVGREEVAIRHGKGFVGATWDRDDLDGMAGMSLSVGANLTVTLAYESSKWAQELDRRRKVLSAAGSGGGRQQ
ncbi:MAG TPA: hypothetical protein VKD69_17885 [Vicinamibacterales bacterium]|nr:hypothetical protein [Vicinamibacterales bacterium]